MTAYQIIFQFSKLILDSKVFIMSWTFVLQMENTSLQSKKYKKFFEVVQNSFLFLSRWTYSLVSNGKWKLEKKIKTGKSFSPMY